MHLSISPLLVRSFHARTKALHEKLTSIAVPAADFQIFTIILVADVYDMSVTVSRKALH
jgi:hypothetical protein